LAVDGAQRGDGDVLGLREPRRRRGGQQGEQSGYTEPAVHDSSSVVRPGAGRGRMNASPACAGATEDDSNGRERSTARTWYNPHVRGALQRGGVSPRPVSGPPRARLGLSKTALV